ncbi:MAG: hypothetical protein IJI43_04655 [Bacilli bacterium]|nr:hypothetical protein [Bacilli bacterium]
MKKINKLITLILVLGLFSPITTLALTKKETIYNTIDYTGKVEKTIINNHLFELPKGRVEDETELKNILNINGDETFKLEGNKLIWNSNGKDIFYRGEINKELPLSIKTTYYLDGKEVNPKKIVGKKGNIEIRLQFTNNSYSKEDNMYLPLVVTVGTMFTNKDNYNIEISNGKAVDTGTKSIALGLSSPGLYENTGISEFSNFDEVTIKYDTNNFRLSNIYIIATPKVLDTSDFNIFNKIDSLYSAVDKLNTNMDKIDNGAKELVSGIGSAKEGTSKLNSGSKQIDNGVKQIITELDNASGSIKPDEETINNLLALKQGNTDAITNLTTANQTIAESFNDKGLDITLTEEQLIEILTQAGYDQATIESLISYKRTYDGNSKLIYLLSKNNTAIDKTIQSSKETIIKLNTLFTELKKALMKLEYGTNSLNNGINELDKGMSKLYNGSNTLSSGISTFNTEGIKKIVGYSNRFKTYTEKAKRVLNKSNKYKGFGSNNVTRTTFVFKMKTLK